MIKVNDCPKVFITKGLNKALIKAGKKEENIVLSFAKGIMPYHYGEDGVITIGKQSKFNLFKFRLDKKLTILFKEKIYVTNQYNKTFKQKCVSNISINNLKDIKMDELDNVMTTVHMKLNNKIMSWYEEIEKNWNKTHKNKV